jgi:hypothetical protein
VCAQLVGEAALADAGLAGEQDQTPAADEGIVETSGQLGQLGLAAHERAARADRGGLGRARPFGRQVEPRILGENRALELAQSLARLDA